ncbi:glycosyltransferase family 4 protein [Parafilimonas sp.]|uniref:glycosyltransferase family 4 protein n=1 Tax=Parafilimonas sp. TaxID=1969739 RepID=UPI0039E431BD
MKAAKILLNACMYTENPPGVGINTREAYNALTIRLNANNIEYTVYAYNKKGLKNPQFVSEIKLPLLLEFLFRRFISVHRLIWNIFYLPVIAKKYDLVYSFTSYGSPFLKSQVITVHDLICFQYPKQNKFQYIYFKTILPYIIKSCKKIVVISEFTRQDVAKHFKVHPDKLQVIYCGHDHLTDSKVVTDESELKKLDDITGGKPFFFTAGASYGHKNVDKIIEAMQVLPEHLLLVTGPNSAYYNALKKSTVKKGYSNIIFLNYVSDGFLKLLYKKCVANIYISAYEGFGSTPLEAAMNNKVSVVSNKSVLPEIYGDSVMYVDPENPEEIKNALISVASPGFNADVYKIKFPGLINKYSWGNMADGIIDVILQGLNKKSNQAA